MSKVLKGITENRCERLVIATNNALVAGLTKTQVFHEIYKANGLTATSKSSEFTACHTITFATAEKTHKRLSEEQPELKLKPWGLCKGALKTSACRAKKAFLPAKEPTTPTKTGTGDNGNSEAVKTAVEVQEQAVKDAESCEAIITNAISLIHAHRKDDTPIDCLLGTYSAIKKVYGKKAYEVMIAEFSEIVKARK